MKNIIILIFLALILGNCSYKPIYKNNLNQAISITILSFEGDENLNKKLSSELVSYQNSEDKKNYNIKIKTNLERKVISKDNKGNTTTIELIGNAIFIIIKDDGEQRFSFNENLKIQNNDDSFEQEKYEEIVIHNFAKSIKRKLISQLNNL